MMVSQITNNQIELVLATLKAQEKLFCTSGDAETPTPFYHMQADAICWSDEIPEGLSYNAMRIVQFLLSLRSQAYANPQLAFSDVLDRIQEIVPDWPFLRKDRHDVKWLDTLVALREQELNNLESQLKQRNNH